MNNVQVSKKFRAEIIKWSCIGLALRFIIMPFTMHTCDLVFMNYSPMMFIKEGIWDPYGYVNAYLHYNPAYYGPVTFLIMSVFNFVFVHILHADMLVKMLEASGPMIFKDFSTAEYVRALSQFGIFGNLFLMKLPYLAFDFLIGAFLLKFSCGTQSKLNSYKLWMLNVVVLHSTYALGQSDIFPAFFIITSLYAAIRKRPYLSIVLLSFGGATKLFPYFLIPPACLLLGKGWKQRLLLMSTAAVSTAALYLPFYLSSGNCIFTLFAAAPSAKQYTGASGAVLVALCMALYGYITLSAAREAHQPNPQRKLLFYFLTAGFLVYAAQPISFRYLVFITPLLALVMPHNRRFFIFTIILIVMLGFLRLAENEAQLGMLAPLNPEYFKNLPYLQEVLGRFININLVYRVMSRILLLALFTGACWSWRMRLKVIEEIC